MAEIGARRGRPSRFVLNPAARVLWRAAGTVQLELGQHALVLDSADADALQRLIRELTSTGTRRTRERAQALDLLADEGFIWSASRADCPSLTATFNRSVSETTTAVLPTPRLAGDLGALRVRFGVRATEVLATRRAAVVAVRGSGRLAAAVATLLAASGIGHVTTPDSADVRISDAAPGGLTPSDEGRRFGQAARDAIHRCAPETVTAAVTDDGLIDLQVLALDAPFDPEFRERLHGERAAHLAVATAPDHFVVGPLVLPGLTSCLRCADRHRMDRDASWAALAAQLCTPRRHAAPSDLALTTMAAAIATIQALAYIDGDEPAALDASLELYLPDWRVRRRQRTVHPACDCATV
ncbi:MAG: hypothetical protein JO147_01465 [Actinobacteria bacterium]|nr:hypothetical protein [Actinomycetota bacterium]